MKTMRKWLVALFSGLFLVFSCLGIVSCKDTEQVTTKKIQLNYTEYVMNVGDSVQLTADTACTWGSQNSAIASVSLNGTVVAVSLGTTEIIATATNAKGVCKITVTDELLGEPTLSVNLKSQGIFIGDTLVCQPTVKFGNKTADLEQFDLHVTSSNQSVATVDGFVLTGVAEGETDITVAFDYKGKEYSVTKKLTVGNVVDVWFEQAEYSTIMGETFSVTLLGVDKGGEIATDEVVWVSSNPDIVSCEKGTLTALGNGSVTLTATYKECVAECVVDIYQPVWTSDEVIAILDKTDGNYILMQDIDMSETAMKKGGAFSGKIDGNGYALIGIHYTDRLMSLFSSFSGVIKNVEFRKVSFVGGDALIRTALIADYMKDGARVENCYFDVTFGNIGSANFEWGAYLSWGFTAGVVAAEITGTAYIKDCYIQLKTPNNGKIDYTGFVVGNIMGSAHLENVICEQAGELSYKAVGGGEIVEKGATGIYNKSAATSVAKSVLGSSWNLNNGISIKDGLKVFNGYVPYYVDIEVESLDGDGYDLEERKTLYAFAGQTVEGSSFIKEIYGLTYDETNSNTSIVVEDGSKITLRYNRKTYTVTLKVGNKEESKTYRYEEYCNTEDFDLEAPEVNNKVLIGWGDGADFAFEVTQDVVGGPVYATPIYTYADFLKIQDDLTGNYVLMNDIDPLAEKGVKEELVTIVFNGNFSGILDGQGYAIKNITFYEDNAPWTQDLGLFDTVSGTLKDIGFDNFRLVPTNAGNSCGAIARYFTGTAKNVYANVVMTKTYYQYNGQQYGAMFGTLGEGAVVRDCFIRLSSSGSNCYYQHGYVAGTASGSARIEKVVILKGSSYASLVCYQESATPVQKNKILIADEATIKDLAVDILGRGWICDSVELPRIKKPGEENIVSGKIPYTLKYFFNSKENPNEYLENSKYAESFKGATGVEVNLTEYVQGKAFSGYQFDGARSTLTGVVTKDGQLVLEAYYTFNAIAVSTYNEFYNAVKNYPTAYIYLTNDIDPLAEKGIGEQLWGSIIPTFVGVIDGQGYSISNVGLYGLQVEWYEPLSMFQNFSGTIKNIALKNFLHSLTNIQSGNGIIARNFTGVAENVYIDALVQKTTYQYDGQQYGTMFGVLGDGAIVRNCYIKTRVSSSNCVSAYGYIAGTVRGKVTIENIVAVTASSSGALFAYCENATVNGTLCASLADVTSAIEKLLVTTEAEAIEDANTVLGEEWICDGVNVPRLKKVGEEDVVIENALYTIKYFFNTKENENAYAENLECKETIKGIVGEELDITEYLQGKAFPFYQLNEARSTLTGAVTKDGQLVLEAYYSFNAIAVSTYDEFYNAVKNYPTAYIYLTNDIDPLAEKGIGEQLWGSIIPNFVGVIDGQGYSISNVGLYGLQVEWYEPLSMFQNFSGTIKNIALKNFLHSLTNLQFANGIIARNFTGTAENVYIDALVQKTTYQYDGHQYGTMFGTLNDGAVVRNCYIKTRVSSSNCVSAYGYIAGTVKGNVTIENIVAVTASDSGALFAYCENATVNGTACASTADVMTAIEKLLVVTEAEAIENADSVLGEAWICDGENTPTLRK